MEKLSTAGGPEHGRIRMTAALAEARDQARSEISAAHEAFAWGPGGALRARKWLGWALYRVASKLNPEIQER